MFGTHVEADVVRVPRRLAMRWLVDDRGEVRPEYADTYELRGATVLDEAQLATDEARAFANQAPVT